MLSCVRRTSIVVEDMEKSLKFYEKGLGLKVFYNNVIEAEASAKLMGIPSPKVHLVSLQSGEETFGMVGLMKFLRPVGYETRKKAAEEKKTDIVLVFRTDSLDSIYENLVSLEFDVFCKPLVYEIPGRGMAKAFSCFDPNGILCEFTQYL